MLWAKRCNRAEAYDCPGLLYIRQLLANARSLKRLLRTTLTSFILFLHDLEQAYKAGNTIDFQGWKDRHIDTFLRAGLVRHDQIDQ